MKRITIYIALLVTFLSAGAQNGRLLTTDRELHNSYVNDVCQDTKGYVWIASRGGLLRYDGYHFQTYRENEGNSGIMSNYVNQLCCDGSGQFFVGTSNGVLRYDYAGNRFIKVPLGDQNGDLEKSNIYSMSRTHEGDVLVTTTGYGVYRIKSGGKRGDLIAGYPFEGNIKNIAEGKDGTIWGASDDCGVAYMKGKEKKTYLTQEAKDIGCNNVVVGCDGTVVVGTFYNGLYQYDPIHDVFQHIPISAGMHVFSMVADAGGRILVGTDGNGVYEYDPQAEILTASMMFSRDVDLQMGKVSSMTFDQDGNLWIGLLQKGVYMQPASRSPFTYVGHKSDACNTIGSSCVMSVYADSQGEIWVGTDGDGIYVVDTKGQQLRHFQAGTVPSTIMCVTEDKNGNILAGSYLDGGGYVDRQSGRYKQLPVTASGDAQHVYDILPDAEGSLWIATLGDGLKCYNPKTSRLEEFGMKAGANPTTNAIPNKWLRGLAISHDRHRLYISTTPGLACYDLVQKSFIASWGKHILFEEHQTYCVHENRDGSLWVGADNGLHLIDKKGNELRHIGTENGMAGSAVYSIEEDGNGHLWLGTDYGLVRYTPEIDELTTYFSTDGIQANEFSERASYKTSSGLLLFGGTDGLTIFHPDSLNRKSKRLQVHLTDMLIGGEHVRKGMKSGRFVITHSGIDESETFHVCSSDNSITFSFSAMEYVTQESIQFLYRINGENWQSMGVGKNELSLNHLAPATYHIEVKAASQAGGESAIHKFAVVVHPAWYASTWAYLTYLIVAAVLVLLYVRHLRRQEQLQLRLQEHIHAEQLDEARLRLAEANARESEVNARFVESRKKIIDNITQEQSAVESPDEKLLKRIIGCINKNVSDADYNVELIAKEVGLSRVHLYRKMKELTGQSPSEFISQVRMSNAAKMLSERKHSIEDVAYACGFNSTNTFSRKFKKFYGKSPREYRDERENVEDGRCKPG